MATWKKVIVSGSNAVLNQITASGIEAPRITGSLDGTASYALFALTASYVSGATGLDSVSASWASQSLSSSYISGSNVFGDVSSSLTSSYSAYAISASYAVSYSYVTQSEISSASWASASVSASYAESASYAVTASYIFITQSSIESASFASSSLTASYVLPLNQLVQLNGTLNVGKIAVSDTASNFFVGGNATGEVILQSTTGDIELQAVGHEVAIKSNLQVTGSVTANSFTGSLLGTASRAVSASIADTASYFSSSFFQVGGNTTTVSGTFVVSGSSVITGSQTVIGDSIISGSQTISGSLTVTQGLTSSLDGTASWAINALTASYYGGGVESASWASASLTASWISGSNVAGAVFSAYSASHADTASALNTITSPARFDNTVTINGDLTVAGTASFQNTKNLNVADQFILLSSGAANLQDSGLIVASGSNVGVAFYLETANTGDKGRWAVAADVAADATTATADAYSVTATSASGSVSAAPQFGGSSNGFGNIHIDSVTGDIYIYA